MPELVTGTIAAAVGATGVTMVRSQRLIAFNTGLRWALGLWRVLPHTVFDIGVRLAVMWGRLVLRQPVRQPEAFAADVENAKDTLTSA
jgi:hypothetical protein